LKAISKKCRRIFLKNYFNKNKKIVDVFLPVLQKIFTRLEKNLDRKTYREEFFQGKEDEKFFSHELDMNQYFEQIKYVYRNNLK
ncbi:hypothetical protein, partial [Aerococcus mictus]|uniref:hypothetical protein n=1 Tax=Aerococcus mictus TaxID=2976810 RepID=UPI00256A9792